MSTIARIVMVAVAAMPPAAHQTAQTNELAVAFVRPDGILVPVAVYDGKSWLNPWPEPTDVRTMDRMISAFPNYWRDRAQLPPEQWRVARASGGPIAVKVLSHVIFDEHCGHQVGLLTDMPRSGEDSHEKQLATSAPVLVSMPVDLMADAELRRHITRLVERQEAAKLAEWEKHSGWKSQAEAVAGRKPIQIRLLLGHSDAGSRTVYYEAEREYGRALSDRPGDEPAILVAAGWIYQSRTGPALDLESGALITSRDQKESSTLKPLGILRVGGSTVWIGQEHGYESEAAAVIRVDEKGVHRLLTTFIGGC